MQVPDLLIFRHSPADSELETNRQTQRRNLELNGTHMSIERVSMQQVKNVIERVCRCGFHPGERSEELDLGWTTGERDAHS